MVSTTLVAYRKRSEKGGSLCEMMVVLPPFVLTLLKLKLVLSVVFAVLPVADATCSESVVSRCCWLHRVPRCRAR